MAHQLGGEAPDVDLLVNAAVRLEDEEARGLNELVGAVAQEVVRLEHLAKKER